jgi:hypothetical protein
VRFLLVHSPLVGPSTWRFVADVLASLGHEADVPDLRDAAQSADPRQFVVAAQSALAPSTEIIAGHSGAGFFLPSIAAPHRGHTLVFVDAKIPPRSGRATPNADFIDRLRSMAVNGMLPRWSRWWSEEVMTQLLPDPQRRLEIEADLPDVPLAFYETAITIPDNWFTARAGFLLLSESYREDAQEAATAGWPTVELVGGHLDLVNYPDSIARGLVALASTDR